MTSGRKRAFDKQDALNEAMRVFWKKGYVGASLADLTESMGINKPSMYSAFGNKEDLFIEATRYYLEQHARPHAEYLTEAGLNFKDRIRNYLMSVVAAQCDSAGPKGCYISLCISEAAGEGIPDNARALIDEAATYAISLLSDFLQQDSQACAEKLDVVAVDKATYLVSILHGTAALARSGKTLVELEPVVETAMQCFE